VLAHDSNSDPRWFTVDEAALYLRVSPGNIRTLIHRQDIRASRLGPSYRLDRVDLDVFLEKRKQYQAPYRKGTRPAVAARHARQRARKARVS
jgi:excisionase family DNA binding protein